MIGIGALVGVGLILLDTMMGAMKKLRIPPLSAVGIGIYLPMSATFAVIIGAVISHWYDGRTRTMANPARAERLGTLVASGLIVGESIWGVINAGLIVGFAEATAPIALVPGDFALAPWLGVVGFVGAILWLYGVDAEAVESGAVARSPKRRSSHASAHTKSRDRGTCSATRHAPCG